MRSLTALLLSVSLAAGASEDWTLDALMAELHQVRGAAAHFTETKTAHMLTRPLQASGTLTYAAPDKLEKVTESPAHEAIRLEGDILSGKRADGEDFSVDIASHAEIAALVEGIRSTLAGDLATLRRYYEVAFAGDREHWRIDLSPKDKKIKEKIEFIRISGSGAVIGGIIVSETDGDRSEMTVTPDRP